MGLGLGKNAVLFKDTFCLSKKKCTDVQNIHDTLVYGHEDPTRIDACCNFCENVMDLNQNTAVHWKC